MVIKHPAKTNARIIGHDVTMWETGYNSGQKASRDRLEGPNKGQRTWRTTTAGRFTVE